MKSHDERRHEMQTAWGDAVYEAWRRGLDSDLVDRDRMNYDQCLGFFPEECGEREVNRLAQHKQKAELEKEEQG